MIKEGLLYAATGEKYIKEAEASLKSLLRHSPNVHATLITDEDARSDVFSIVKRVDVDRGDMSDKVRRWKSAMLLRGAALLHSPYQKTLHVDTDTYFCGGVGELFRLLDYYDLLIAQAPAESSKVKIDGEVIEGYYTYNCGVIAYKNTDEIRSFLKTWLSVYKEKFNEYSHDQAPFMEALLAHRVKLYTLPSLYNFRIPFFMTALPGKIKILHGRADNYKKLEKKLNKRLEHRVWLPHKNKVLYYSDRFPLHWLYRLLPNPLRQRLWRIKRTLKRLKKFA